MKHLRIVIGALIVCVLLFALSLVMIIRGTHFAPAEPEPVTEVTPEPEPEPEPVKKEEYEYEDAELADLYQELKQDQEINPDVRAILHFHSGLIRTPVLYSTWVDDYLYKDWETGEYRSYGSIAMDPVNDLSEDDQNTLLYGHYVYEFRNADRTLAFTPLSLLTEKEEWEKNRYVSLITDTDVRYYEIASVFECPLVEYDGYQVTAEGMEYNRVYYDKEYMDIFRTNIAAHEYYQTGVEFDETDRFLTMQTCIEGKHSSREIVFCRELMRKPLNEETGEVINNGAEGKDS